MAQTKAECKPFFIILYKFNAASEKTLQRSAVRLSWPAMGREKTARVCRRMNESGGAYSGWHVQMVSPFM